MGTRHVRAVGGGMMQVLQHHMVSVEVMLRELEPDLGVGRLQGLQVMHSRTPGQNGGEVNVGGFEELSPTQGAAQVQAHQQVLGGVVEGMGEGRTDLPHHLRQLVVHDADPNACGARVVIPRDEARTSRVVYAGGRLVRGVLSTCIPLS